MISDIFRPLRLRYWWFYKIPPLIAVCYVMAFYYGLTAETALRLIVQLLVIFFCIFSYGYVINDVFDIHEDKLSGKPNRLEQFSAVVRYVYLVVPVLVCGLCLFFFANNIYTIFICAGNFIIVTLYSAPPIRLKDHGLAGVIADALGAHIFPTTLVILMSRAAVPLHSETGLILPWVTIVWAICLGLRGIILHQILDYEHDRAAGVLTLPHIVTRRTLKRFILGFCFPVEIIALLGMILIILPAAPFPAVVLVVYIALELAKIRLDWKMTCFHPEDSNSERYIPFVNNQFYETFWPLSLAIQFALLSPVGIVHFLLVLVLFFPNIWLSVTMNSRLCADLFERLQTYVTQKIRARL